MAYDPAELQLPPWLLHLLNRLIGLRLPLPAGWSISVTRPGALYVAALLAIWAAAFYSGNNLLYLCAAMMSALIAVACYRAVRLLHEFPDVTAALPLLHAGQSMVIRQPIAVPPVALPARLQLQWSCADEALSLSICCSGEQALLSGCLQFARRGLYRCPEACLSSAAPLGLLMLRSPYSHGFSLIVLPAAVPWHGRGGEYGGAQAWQGAAGEGDEWQDLRAYVPGDARARIHWRKADTDSSRWMVKRFGSSTAAATSSLLRVDLRLPAATGEHAEAAFEQLLGRALFWLRQPGAEQLILGQHCFNLNDPAAYRGALMALAAVVPDSSVPAGQGGILLSLLQPAGGVAHAA